MKMKTAIGGIALAAAAMTAACSGRNCQAEFGGYPFGEMPDLDMHVGDTVVEAEVWKYFIPDWCPPFNSGPFGARASDPAAVAVSAVSGADSAVLTVAALAVADSVRVTVWATGYGSAAVEPRPNNSHEFLVRVRPR